jgi:hypothetical protein
MRSLKAHSRSKDLGTARRGEADARGMNLAGGKADHGTAAAEGSVPTPRPPKVKSNATELDLVTPTKKRDALEGFFLRTSPFSIQSLSPEGAHLADCARSNMILILVFIEARMTIIGLVHLPEYAARRISHIRACPSSVDIISMSH